VQPVARRAQGGPLQPATQIGSHVVSNSVTGFFFFPGVQIQIGSSPQVAPQCMQAGGLSLAVSAPLTPRPWTANIALAIRRIATSA
jgi:hypothetical protein